MEASRSPSPRTLLVMGRVSNLPTVWSNVFCGWLLGGGGSIARLLAFGIGASALYVGGMYLNDAFDADFDRQHRRERPIPSGAIDEGLAWRIGGALIGAGTLLASLLGWSTAILSTLLALAVLLYDAVHKAVAFSPVIMASCRLLLLMGAASTGHDGVTGIAIWASLVLAGWIVGLSYVARRESVRGPMAAWPMASLALPAVLALIVLDGNSRARGLLWTALLAAWAGRCLVHVLHPSQRNLGRGVSGLLAGICLVDLLAAGTEAGTNLVFLALFAISLLAQRFVPAT